MTPDEFLKEFSTTSAALGLLLVSLLAILLLKDRKLARGLFLPVALLVAFLLLELGEHTWHEADPMFAHGLAIAALAVFAVAAVRVIAVVVVDWFLKSTRHVELPKIVRDLLVAGLYFFALAFIFKTAFAIDLTALFTSAALLSVVIGLGLQDTLGGLFAGLAMQAEPPFAVGDWVTFGTRTARVQEISWRVTRLVTFGGDLVVVPNSVMSKSELVNHSRPTRAHIRFLEIGLPYATPPSLAKSVIAQAIATVPGVLPTPAPGVMLKQFGESSVTYLFYFFIDDFEKHYTIESDVQAALWYALRRADITIPFPIRTIYMHEAADEVTSSTVFLEAERLLADVDFLKILDEDLRRGLARRMRSVQFGAGETVVRQGDPGETFYIVADGEVNVRLRGADGVEKKLSTLHRGNFFGEMSLLTGEPRSASIVARTDTLLLAIDRDGFRETLLQHPDIARQMAEILSHRAGQIAAAQAEAGGIATNRESGRILGRLRELFKLS